jgi:hypothetical protein
MNQFFVLIFSVLFLSPAWAQQTQIKKIEAKPSNQANKANAKIQYKKEDYFDFEALSVKGDLLNPLDLSNKANKRMRFNRGDYIRKNFDDYMYRELLDTF